MSGPHLMSRTGSAGCVVHGPECFRPAVASEDVPDTVSYEIEHQSGARGKWRCS